MIMLVLTSHLKFIVLIILSCNMIVEVTGNTIPSVVSELISKKNLHKCNF